MGGNGDCGCSGGGCSGNGNGNGTNGAAKLAGYNGVNQRRMLMPGPFLVRKPAVLANGTTVTGDGKGSENPVPVAGANQVVLLLDGNKGTSDRAFNAYMEVTINGTDYYRETDVGTGSTAAVTKKTYQAAASVWTASTDERLAIAINVLAAFARFTFFLSGGTTGNYDNVACRAITGRV
jgi:hypothetical protein